MARSRIKHLPAANEGSSTVRLALRMIESRACQGLTVKQMLRELRISRMQLEREFEAALARTPGQMLKLARLNRAEELLSGTAFPIKQIARAVGFQRASNFCDFFRTNAGLSPSEYRSAHAARQSGAAGSQRQSDRHPPASFSQAGMPINAAAHRPVRDLSERPDMSGLCPASFWPAMPQLVANTESILFAIRQNGVIITC